MNPRSVVSRVGESELRSVQAPRCPWPMVSTAFTWKGEPRSPTSSLGLATVGSNCAEALRCRLPPRSSVSVAVAGRCGCNRESRAIDRGPLVSG
eukprot:4067010-Alexandrium_andersonii.AAC.1